MMALQEVAESVPGVAEGRFDGPLGAAHDGGGLGDPKPDEIEAIDGEALTARQARNRAGEVELVVDRSSPGREASRAAAVDGCASALPGRQ